MKWNVINQPATRNRSTSEPKRGRIYDDEKPRAKRYWFLTRVRRLIRVTKENGVRKSTHKEKGGIWAKQKKEWKSWMISERIYGLEGPCGKTNSDKKEEWGMKTKQDDMATRKRNFFFHWWCTIVGPSERKRRRSFDMTNIRTSRRGKPISLSLPSLSVHMNEIAKVAKIFKMYLLNKAVRFRGFEKKWDYDRKTRVISAQATNRINRHLKYDVLSLDKVWSGKGTWAQKEICSKRRSREESQERSLPSCFCGLKISVLLCVGDDGKQCLVAWFNWFRVALLIDYLI